jgi:hypothetical protein
MRLALLAALLACGCPTHGGIPRPSPEPTVADVVARLAKARDAVHSFKTVSLMDYWLGEQRVKGTVAVIGETGAKVRFQALSPSGDTLADLACDGTNFVYIDYQHNCTRTGPCTKSSIASLLHVELEPEDFMHIALGTVPVIADAKGTVTWDSDKGYERVALTGTGGAQKIAIEVRDNHWDIVETEMTGPDGKVAWSVENTGFHDKDGLRIPGKTRFKTPQEKADLIVDWKNQDVNPTLDPSKFQLTAPAGLATCK